MVLDIRMAGVTGLDVLAGLREASDTRSIPVIVLSANAAEGTRSQALDLGTRYFLEKPHQPVTMVSAVEAAAGEHASASTGASASPRRAGAAGGPLRTTIGRGG